jgi:hypothetical protein
MKNLSLCAALAAVFVCGSAMAQTLSGKYILTFHTVCQPTVTFTSAGGGGISTGQGGDTVNHMILATFNPVNHSIAFNGFEDVGDVLLVNNVGGRGGSFGSLFAQSATSGQGPYSNSVSTLTLQGRTDQAFFGQIDKNGVAHYFTWLGVYNNNVGVPCSELGVASRQ